MVNRVLISLARLAALVVAFAILASLIPAHGGTAADIAVANAMRSIESDTGHVIFTWISWLGDTALSALLLLAVGLLLYHRRWWGAATLLATSLSGMVLNNALKPLFHRPRPDYAIEFIAGSTWSFPSGHSMASIIGFGVLAYFRRELEENASRRVTIITTAAIIIAAVGFSRLYLGVHYFTDVIGGFLAGAIWLLVGIETYRIARDFSR